MLLLHVRILIVMEFAHEGIISDYAYWELIVRKAPRIKLQTASMNDRVAEIRLSLS